VLLTTGVNIFDKTNTKTFLTNKNRANTDGYVNTGMWHLAPPLEHIKIKAGVTNAALNILHNQGGFPMAEWNEQFCKIPLCKVSFFTYNRQSI
jgi:hypothetical protein